MSDSCPYCKIRFRSATWARGGPSVVCRNYAEAVTRQRERLEAAGWHCGSAAEFLGLSPAEIAEVERRLQQSRETAAVAGADPTAAADASPVESET